MTSDKDARINRKRRHIRIRGKVAGTATRPRLCVFRSSRYLYAQLVDDTEGRTLTSASSLETDIKAHSGSKTEDARLIGTLLGKRALDYGIKKVVFDRGGYKYHGRVRALADAAREAGLEF